MMVSGLALASPWSLSVSAGGAIPANAVSGGQAELTGVHSACGCTVIGTADSRVPFMAVGARYVVNRWIAVNSGVFGARQMRVNLTLTGSGVTAPAVIRDRLIGGYLMAQFHHPLFGRWRGSIGGGIAVTSDSEDGSITVNGVTTSVPSDTTTHTSPAFSIGAHYAFNAHWRLGVSYLEIVQVGSSGNQYTAGPVGLAAATASYRF